MTYWLLVWIVAYHMPNGLQGIDRMDVQAFVHKRDCVIMAQRLDDAQRRIPGNEHTQDKFECHNPYTDRLVK